MIAKIYISYKDGILDPQGATVKKALKNIGIENIESVRIGKYIEMTFKGISKSDAEKLTEKACSKLLANHNTESFNFEVTEKS